MVGVFLLFALAAGMLRSAGNDAASPLIKALVDGGNNAILVTDTAGRVIYANAAYLKLVEATGADDVRPVERVFVGDPGVSEAVFRLLKAAREGRRLQEEVRVDGMRGETGRWLRMRVRPLGDSKREAKLTVWSIADVTRELERQENVFQELQHAIDYLDHAPAGFFSVDAAGSISYLNATLAEWLEQDLAEVGSGGLKLARHHRGRGRRARHHAVGRARRGEDRAVRHRSQDQGRPHRSGAALPQGRVRRRRHARAVAHAGHQPRRRQRQRSAARGRSALHALLPEHADGDRHRRPAGHDRALERAVCAAVQSGAEGRGSAAAARSSRWSPSATAPALEAAIRRAADKQGEIAPVDAALEGAGERFARFYVTAVEEDGDQEAAIVYALETTEQRGLAEPAQPAAEDGAGRPARRRHRARLQQRARRHHDGVRLPGERPQADRSVVPGHHPDQAERQPRRRAGAPPARVLAQADAAPAGHRPRRGGLRSDTCCCSA